MLKLLSVLVLVSACGKPAPRGSLAERGCAAHLKARAHEKMPAGAAESGKCVAALTAMERRTTPSGFICAINCLQLQSTVALAERCAYRCEDDALPAPKDPARVTELVNLWWSGVVGDHPPS